MPELAAVLFDMNGVIVDDEHLHEAAFRRVLEAHGASLSAEGYQAHFMGRTDRDGYLSYFGDEASLPAPLDELLRAKSEAYRSLAADSLQPYPGVLDCIAALGRDGIQLALVTSSLAVEADAVLAAFSIADAFEQRVTAESVTNGKPDPEGYDRALRLLGVEPAAAVVVEDALSGVRAAHRAGIRCLAVTHTHSAEALAEADAVVDHLDGDTLTTLRALVA